MLTHFFQVDSHREEQAKHFQEEAELIPEKDKNSLIDNKDRESWQCNPSVADKIET